MISPVVSAARVVSAAGPGELAKIGDIVDQLERRVEASGTRATIETLTAQAYALQALFTRLTERAMQAQTIAGFDTYMRLALRAQAQCTKTLETVETVAQGPAVYAKQANVVHGHQQVNVGMATPAECSEIGANELFASGGSPDVAQMDPGGTRASVSRDSKMAPMGEFNRPEERDG